MKKNFVNLMTILMVAIMSVCFISCGGNDDANALGFTNNEVIEQLKAYKWYCSTTEFNETSYAVTHILNNGLSIFIMKMKVLCIVKL